MVTTKIVMKPSARNRLLYSSRLMSSLVVVIPSGEMVTPGTWQERSWASCVTSVLLLSWVMIWLL